MIRVIKLIRKQPKSVLIALMAAQILLVGIIDYLTGPNLAFSIFYLFPVLAVSISFGRREGLIVSLACTAAWFVIDLVTPGAVVTPPFLKLWNALVNLNFFLIVTFSLTAMRAAQKKQEELLQFIVHDLRSPLSNMIMGLQGLTLDQVGTLNETQQGILKRAMASGNWMATLINSLLDMGLLESGGMKLAPSPATLREILDEALEQISLLAENRGVILEKRANAPQDEICIDRQLTVRILVNLLSNAAKYTPRGRRVMLEAERSGNEVMFAVKDEGPGVPKEYLATVFDKYVQVEARQAGALVGSGLGLNFCRLGVQAQKGSIWMESEPGQGTTVKFVLPTTVRVNKNVPGPETAEAPGAEEKIPLAR